MVNSAMETNSTAVQALPTSPMTLERPKKDPTTQPMRNHIQCDTFTSSSAAVVLLEDHGS